MESLYSVIPCPFANKASLFPKQDFFVSQSMLLYFPNKTSLQCTQALFALRQNLYGARQRVMCVFLFFYSFTFLLLNTKTTNSRTALSFAVIALRFVIYVVLSSNIL